MFFAFNVFGQNESYLPNVDVKTLNRQNFNFSQIKNDSVPILIHFWATWCTHCHNQLDNIAEVYDDWQAQTGVKVVAVSIDDSRTSSKVAPFIAAKGWEYEIYLDQNGDLKRAMGVNLMPHTFIVNREGVIVWQSSSYLEGDETEMFEVIMNL